MPELSTTTKPVKKPLPQTEASPKAPASLPLPDHLGCRDLYRDDDRDPFGRG